MPTHQPPRSGILARGPAALRAAAVLAALVVAWAPDAFLGLGTYWHHDLRTHHYPWRAWGAARWLQGELPLWCGGAANGYPLLADGQAGLLYPPGMLLFALLPDPLALAWSVQLHSWWAALGTFLLARALGRSRPAALLAGIGFGFGGFLVTHTLYLGMLHAVAWLPFTLYAVLRATAALHSDAPAAPARRWWVAVAAGMALMALAGHVQAAAFSWLLVGLVVLWRVLPSWREPRRAATPLLSFSAAALGALGLASPQLAASFELSRFSMREGGVAQSFAGIGSLPPWELINGVLPRFFGLDRPADILQTYYHRGAGYWGTGENHWEMAFYLGIPVIVFASWSLWRRGERFWWGVVAAALLLMLGRYTPVWSLFRMFPGMGFFRFPVRFAIWLSLAASLLAAAGLDGLLHAAQQQARELRGWARAVTAITLLGLAGLGLVHLGLQLADGPVRDRLTAHYMTQTELPPPPPELGPLQRASLPDPEPEDPAQVPAKVHRILQNLSASTDPGSRQLLWPLALVAILVGGILLVRRNRLSAHRFALGACALLAADLFAFGGNYNPRVPADLARAHPAVLDALDDDLESYRVTVVDRRVDPALDVALGSASLGLLWGLQDVIITSPLLMVRNELVLAMAGLDVGAERGRVKVDQLLDNLPLASFLGLRFVTTTHRIQDPRLEPVLAGSINMYRNLVARPLATLVGCARVVQTPEASWEGLQTLAFDSEAVVELSAGSPSLSSELTSCALRGPPGTAALTEHSDHSWSVTTSADRPALLVLAETWYPGWQATVDGQAAPVHLANMAFKAVEVPAGEHQVQLRYRPAWLGTTGLLAALALLAGLLALLLPSRGSHQNEP